MSTIPLAKALVAALLLTACTAATAPPPGPTAAAPASASVPPSSTESGTSPPFVPPRKLCAAALSGRKLLGWGPTTVGDLRAYRYGPPGMTPPLADAFAGVRDDAVASLCATRASGPHATAWWGVVDGTAGHLITIDGPGEGRRLGEITRPPVVP